MSVTSVWAALSRSRDFACTVIESIDPYPVRVSCTAVSGAKATSSWSVVPLDPFELVTPITSKLVPLTAIVWPIGSWPENSSLTTVGPITSTRSCARSCALVNQEPPARE
jgi:hypothetical protein